MHTRSSGRMIEVMSTGPGSRPQASEGVDETLKDFWVSRPRRPRRGRKIAGVAAAVGNRYAIDPVIVRVALVVTAFIGGFGLLAYLLGWLFFPEEGDEVSPAESLCGRGRSSTSHALTIVLCIALIPVFTGAFGGAWFNGGGFIGLALLAAGLYLLHRSRGTENRPVTPAPNAPADAGPAETPTETTATGSASFAPAPSHATHTAEGWDPLAASPFGWDFAEQEPANLKQQEDVPRRKSRVGVVTAGLALLIAGVGTALNLAGHGWFSPQHIIGLSLAIVGLGMLAGSLAGGGRGLLALAVPLSLAGLVLTAVPFGSIHGGGWGNMDVTPGTSAEVQAQYQRSAGNIDLDLSQLSDSGPVSTSVHNTMGNTTVIVPDEAEVTFTCRSAMGNVDCLGQAQEGFGSEVSATDAGDSADGAARITLDVEATMGNVEVRRG